MNNNTNKNNNPRAFLDVSRFTRWVNRLDEKDKSLKPARRRRKWILTIVLLFLLFGLSFIWFPSIRLEQKPPASPVTGESPKKIQSPGHSALELPADSFEQTLKQKIHEDLSEKK